MKNRGRLLVFLAAGICASVGCSGKSDGNNFLLPPPALLDAVSWNGPWVSGSQTQFPVTFQSIGQTATVVLQSQVSPPFTLTAGSCVSVPSNNLTTLTFSATAVQSGSCLVSVQGSPPNAAVAVLFKVP